MRYQVYLALVARRGMVVNVEAEDTAEAAAAAWAKCGRPDRPTVTFLHAEGTGSVFRVNNETLTVWRN